MKILTNYLKKFVQIPKNFFSLATEHITEIEKQTNTLPYLDKKIVTGNILSFSKIPESNHLNLVKVKVKEKILQIVCGASNLEENKTVIIALSGSILFDNTKIVTTKIKKFTSEGMICSLKEIGFSKIDNKEEKGIFLFQKKYPSGISLNALLKIEKELLDLSINSNRKDLNCYLGLAREISSFNQKQIHWPEEKKLPLAKKLVFPHLQLDIQDCNFFLAKFIELKIHDSPLWLKTFLISHDIVPVNNLCDALNYTNILLGVSLFPFLFKDPAKKYLLTINQNNNFSHIFWQKNNQNKINLLEYLKQSLELDLNKQVKIMFFGFNGAPIFREKNTFFKNINHHNDIFTLEKGISFFLNTLQQISFVRIYNNSIKKINNIKENKRILLNCEFINQKLGLFLTQEQIITYLKEMHFDVKIINKDRLSVQVPNYRKDIKIKEDIVEEIIRKHGLQKITNIALPKITNGLLTFKQKKIRQIRQLLAHLGFNEIITSSFSETKTIFSHDKKKIALLHPQNKELTSLRDNLYDGMLKTIKYNYNNRNKNLFLFEIGKIFKKQNNNYQEKNMLSIAMTGTFLDTSFEKQNIESSFSMLQAVFEKITSFAKIKVNYKDFEDKEGFFNPFLKAQINTQKEQIYLGNIGMLNLEINNFLKITKDIFLLEINLDLLLQQITTNKENFSLLKQQTITKDVTIAIDKKYPLKEILLSIENNFNKVIKTKIFDLFQIDKENPKQNVSIKIILKNEDNYFNKQNIENYITKIFNFISNKF